MKTRKQSISFPVVGTIRKGGAKKAGKDRNGKDIQVVGDDLKDHFRVVFAPGAEDAQAAWNAIYKDKGGLQPAKIRAMVCFPSVWQAWECFNEAYSAGRMVARADENHFLVLRDQTNGKYLVQDGQPFTEYKPGMKVSYEREGRRFELPMKSTGRLRLFIPELGRMVMLELKTTSFYDCQNISNQLAAIQAIADALNSGNAAGVPFYIYRKEQSITWNKPDGTAARITKWLVQVEVDPAFVQAAMKRMADFALTGGAAVGQLPAGEIAGTEDPDTDEEEDFEGEWSEAAQAAGAQAAPAPAPVAEKKASTGPLNGQPTIRPERITLETAKTVRNSEKVLYWEIPTSSLSIMFNTMEKLPSNKKTEEHQLKMDAIQVILAHRQAHPEDEPQPKEKSATAPKAATK